MSTESFLYAILYVYNYAPNSVADSWFRAFHTLATEEQFYLVYPVLFLFYRRAKVMLALLLGITVLINPWLIDVLRNHGFSNEYHIWTWSIVAGARLALGCLGGLMFYYCRSQLERHKGLIGFLGFAFYIAPIWFSGEIGTPLGCTLCVVYIALAQDSWVVKVLEWGPMDYLGRISYGIYVWQSFFLTTGITQENGWPLKPPLSVVLVFLTAPISYKYLEQPFLKLKDQFGSAGGRKERA